VDALNHATGGSETYPPDLFLPPGVRALEVAGSAGTSAPQASLRYAFQIFGRPMRSPEGQCDCERDVKPTIVQTLFLANHPSVQKKLAAPTGRVAQVLKEQPDDGRRIDELFLWALSRLPTAEERAACSKTPEGKSVAAARPGRRAVEPAEHEGILAQPLNDRVIDLKKRALPCFTGAVDTG